MDKMRAWEKGRQSLQPDVEEAGNECVWREKAPPHGKLSTGKEYGLI